MTPKTTTASRVAGYKHGRVPRAVREQQLLDLAEQLFMDNGYAGFSIEDLCQAAQVSRPVVYDHFGGKDGIYLACLRRIRDEFEAALIDAAGTAPTATAAIEQAADAFFAIVERDPRRWSLVYGGTTVLTGPIAEDLYALRARTIDRIAAIAARFAPTASPEAIAAYAHFISGAGEQLGRWWLHNPDIPRPRVVANYVSFATAALTQLK
ncbi:TetR/AcrR family transcriptional regulator [Kutzneria sp. CA-103260]|uniref:TetR/AcrR family transcriptional regulator n=1 Tax=Kutzneria sp. CA-103260 TaxID=2802641 RepID=UPI001BAC0A3B|nr:TetR/AcrR family transcriptional regulator [Kutzneria sp. CA-103260]QUQ65657.1 TetR family transcriptional regulator [Kutzneria sp. CA-103260]